MLKSSAGSIRDKADISPFPISDMRACADTSVAEALHTRAMRATVRSMMLFRRVGSMCVAERARCCDLLVTRVEALIFTGGMNKNYIGYSLQVEEVGG